MFLLLYICGNSFSMYYYVKMRIEWNELFALQERKVQYITIAVFTIIINHLHFLLTRWTINDKDG